MLTDGRITVSYGLQLWQLRAVATPEVAVRVTLFLFIFSARHDRMQLCCNLQSIERYLQMLAVLAAGNVLQIMLQKF